MTPPILNLAGKLYLALDQVQLIEWHRSGYVVRFVNGTRRIVTGAEAQALKAALANLEDSKIPSNIAA